MIAIALLVVQHLVQHLETHPFSVLLSVAAASGHIGKAVHHTGGPDTAAFSYFAVLTVKEILHGEAGAGGTHKVTASAVDTAAVVFLPHGAFGDLCGQMFRDFHGDIVFFHMARNNLQPRNLRSLQLLCPCLILAIHQVGAVWLAINAHVVVGAYIGAHADTEAVFKGVSTAHQHDFDVLPQALVVVIGRAVVQVHIVQPLKGVEITAAQENDCPFLGRICFLGLPFRKEKQCLRDWHQNLLEGIFRFFVKYNLIRMVDLSVTNTIRIRKTPATRKIAGSIDVIIGLPCLK